MLRDVAEKYYVEGDYNCAETLVRAGNEYYGLGLHDHDMIMVAGFGAGVMSGNICGAILGGVSLLSLKYVEARAHQSTEIRPVTQKLIRAFQKQYGSINCRDIKIQSHSKESGCLYTVTTACDILEQVIEEYEASKQKE